MMYCDDYGIVDTCYIALATTIDPCEDFDQPEYLIGLVLHVGHLGHVTSIAYPQRALRDAAFEQIVALVKHETAAREEEDD